MPLRILLADESTTIKKAFQLALSDLGAEIKSVPSGLDVMTVTLDFLPHIIFADVLLTKKSGYDVCREITLNNDTKHIPVILMWSNFMVFNAALANQVGYADKLEKPFDTAALRKIVTRFYKETEKHPLNGLLDFPAIPETQSFDEEFTPVKLDSNLKKTTPHSYQTSSLDEDDELDDFSIKPHQNIHIETESHGDFEEVVLVQSTAQRNTEQNKISHQIKNYLENSPSALSQIEKQAQAEVKQQMSRQMSQPASNLNKAVQRYDENIVREEVRVMAEKICWQVIPELAEKLIKAELEKLMKNIEKSV